MTMKQSLRLIINHGRYWNEKKYSVTELTNILGILNIHSECNYKAMWHTGQSQEGDICNYHYSPRYNSINKMSCVNITNIKTIENFTQFLCCWDVININNEGIFQLSRAAKENNRKKKQNERREGQICKKYFFKE